MAALNAVTDVPYIQLLTSDDPNEDVFEDRPVLSVAESYVLQHAVNQSRDRWLKRVFPAFAKHQQPSHDMQLCGQFLVVIGPHLFLNTAFYTVRYHPGTLSDTEKAVIAADDADRDEHLYYLLEAVHEGSATEAETEELTHIWETRYRQLSRPTDLVMQFSERPNSFCLFPRGAKTMCELDETGTKVLLRTMLPFNLATLPPGRPPQVATIEIFSTSTEFRDVLADWLGGDNSSGATFANNKQLPPSHLIYQIPVSGLSRTLEAATDPRSPQEGLMRQRVKKTLDRMKAELKETTSQRNITNSERGAEEYVQPERPSSEEAGMAGLETATGEFMADESGPMVQEVGETESGMEDAQDRLNIDATMHAAPRPEGFLEAEATQVIVADSEGQGQAKIPPEIETVSPVATNFNNSTEPMELSETAARIDHSTVALDFDYSHDPVALRAFTGTSPELSIPTAQDQPMFVTETEQEGPRVHEHAVPGEEVAMDVDPRGDLSQSPKHSETSADTSDHDVEIMLQYPTESDDT